MIIASHTVSTLETPVRLSDYVMGLFVQLPSRKSVKKAIKEGTIQLNGSMAETGRWVVAGDQITLIQGHSKVPKPYSINLEVLFEDEDLIISNKPAGLVVSGNQYKTLENALIANFTKSNKTDALAWPQPVHRLDGPTSGLVIAAKTKTCQVKMGQMFEEKLIQKTYHALVSGQMPNKGLIETPIDGKQASTTFELIITVPSLKLGHISLLRLQPRTGRTHQIRIHLATSKHGILGDKLYGNENHLVFHKGLFLSATGLHFSHPITNELVKMNIDIPNKFTALLQRERKRFEDTKID